MNKMAIFNKNIIGYWSIALIVSVQTVQSIIDLGDIDGYNEQICGKTFTKNRSFSTDRDRTDGFLNVGERLLKHKKIHRARMSNGWRATRGEIPWHVFIQAKSQEEPEIICGGVLISDNLVLTAAHCVHNFTGAGAASDIQLSLGMTKRGEPKETRRASRVCVPKSWRISRGGLRDIGLIVLSHPVEYDNSIQPACLPKEAEISDDDCLTSGFGRINNDKKPVYADELQVLPMKMCKDQMAGGYQKCFFTTSKDYAGSPCKGDSGGGLFCKVDGRRYVNGVISRGPVKGCIKGNSAVTIFSNVHALKPYLKDIYDECINNKNQTDWWFRRSFSVLHD